MPVKLILRRDEDMRMTGKRNPYSSDFRIGLSREGKILAYRVTLYQNAGAVADLSPPVMDRALFHATHSYFVPNVHATGVCCRTNLPPNTAFRGFGVPQAAFVMEAAIFQAAERLGVEPDLIRKKNLLREGDTLHFGMKVENAQAARCWEEAEKIYEREALYRRIEDFNRKNSLQKKGLAMMPVCFGIAFDKAVFFNQGYALVHVYNDGSVGVSTKIRQVAAHILSIPAARIKIESVNTTRIANASPTVASFGADLNGHATRLACREILNRLKQFAAQRLKAEEPDDVEIRQGTVYVRGQPESTWNELISDAYFDRINLSAQAHYATPHVHFDENKNKGRPYAYHVFGAALIEATVDCLRGTYRIDSVKAVHDFGKSLHPLINLGQAEGAIAQGVGWMTMEEILHDENGRLLSDTLSSYKIPDIYSTPEIAVSFLENAENPLGIFRSKAVGEPPLLYGIGAWFAILRAMKAFRPDIKIAFSAPMTPEKVLLSLCNERELTQDGSHV
uniref:Molybdopterin-binding domain of aldehyde dehydrogenase n=1 Tax=Candidatus Kentrum sp. DK TaxID=2126562 RepID=A0A450SB37_9GAMM|nr:MAG: Molybdopterin-binding domain of aldehyde dehydrogenase [Candidatus Kentron sp. DK]